MSRVLFLQDDEVLSKSIQSALKDEGFDVVVETDVKKAYKKALNSQFDLYLLDINIPYTESFDMIESLREDKDATPAFFITALNDLGNLSKAYDTGIDNYIKKPFDVDELVVCIKSTISKKYDFIDYRNLKYDTLNKRVIINNKEIPMTKVEKHIFDMLVRNLDQDITKQQFFEAMERPSEMALRVHINKLKIKLGFPIKNSRSIGYRLEKI